MHLMHAFFFYDRSKPTLQDGVAFTDEDVRASAKVCLLGQTVVSNLFPNGENPAGKIIRFNNIPFQVIGVLAAKGQSSFGQDQDDVILAPYTTVQKRILATIYFRTLYVSAVSEGATDAATKEIETILRKSHRLRDADENDFQVRTMAELINTLSSTSNADYLFSKLAHNGVRVVHHFVFHGMRTDRGFLRILSRAESLPPGSDRGVTLRMISFKLLHFFKELSDSRHCSLSQSRIFFVNDI
jgi:hypothetical protein